MNVALIMVPIRVTLIMASTMHMQSLVNVKSLIINTFGQCHVGFSSLYKTEYLPLTGHGTNLWIDK